MYLLVLFPKCPASVVDIYSNIPGDFRPWPSTCNSVYREWRRSRAICALLDSQRYPCRIYYRNLPPCQARTPDSDFEARFCCHSESRIGKSSRSSGGLEIDLTFWHLSVPSSFTRCTCYIKVISKNIPSPVTERKTSYNIYIYNERNVYIVSFLYYEKRFLNAYKSRFSGRIQLIATSWKWSPGVINGPSLCQLYWILRYTIILQCRP